MNLSLILIMLFSGFVLVCCICSLMDYSDKSPVLFRLWKDRVPLKI